MYGVIVGLSAICYYLAIICLLAIVLSLLTIIDTSILLLIGYALGFYIGAIVLAGVSNVFKENTTD